MRLLPLVFVPTLALADVAPGCGCDAGAAPLASSAVIGALVFLAAFRR